MKRVAFHTLGCKVNQYETEAIAEMFKKEGYEIVSFDEKAEVYIINTCSVTGQAENKSCQAARKAKRQNPFSTVVLTGCVAQVSAEDVAQRTGADLVIGNSEKKNIINLIENKGLQVSDIMTQIEYLPLELKGREQKTRGFIKIQEGCSNFCTYCIIPYARGPIRSRPPESVLQEAQRLSQNGYTEIVLVGIHLTSYGKDLSNISLLDILISLHEIKGISRIRLGSLELTPILYDIANNADKLPKLCPHFHISLQSGCDSTLKRMKRRYTTAEYKKAVDMLRTAFHDTAITTDIMVGFPGEDEEEFNQSLDFAKSIAFTKSHIFKYSKRKGTPAAEMSQQVEKKDKITRAKLMQDIATQSEIEFLNSFIGKTVQVLFEMPETTGQYSGYTKNYVSVHINSDVDIWRKTLDVKITSVKDGFLLGELI